MFRTQTSLGSAVKVKRRPATSTERRGSAGSAYQKIPDPVMRRGDGCIDGGVSSPRYKNGVTLVSMEVFPDPALPRRS